MHAQRTNPKHWLQVGWAVWGPSGAGWVQVKRKHSGAAGACLLHVLRRWPLLPSSAKQPQYCTGEAYTCSASRAPPLIVDILSSI
jgi:hypothetical protein